MGMNIITPKNPWGTPDSGPDILGLRGQVQTRTVSKQVYYYFFFLDPSALDGPCVDPLEPDETRQLHGQCSPTFDNL